VGRTVLPPRSEWLTGAAEPFRRQIEGIRGLEALGAHVQAVSLDVADPKAVAAFRAAFDQEARPPIRGVIHSAGVTEDALLPQVSLEQLFKVLRPKLNAGFVLDQAFAGGLDFFILYSSLGSMLGQPGQACYAAANAYLDALAAEGRRQGRRTLAINWGGWAELGLAQTAGARRTIDELERRGVGSFSALLGLDALGRLLDEDAVQAAVVPVDWVRFGEVASRTRVPSLVRDLVHAGAGAPVPAASFRERLEAAPADERRPLLEAHLQRELAQVLRLPAEKIEPHRPMGTLGLESLTALEFRKRLELSLGLRLSATVMWNYPTLAALGEHLSSRVGGKAPVAARPEKAPVAVLPDSDSLSDEEALRALMSKGRKQS
jgi:myxalamid-type polyketide synthase MxaE and MxaD